MAAMADDDFRIEHDTMGEVRVPAAALWRAQTQRAVENFPISGAPHRAGPDRARSALIKARRGAGQRRARRARPRSIADAIAAAADEVAAGDYDDQFPIDVFQTGSGTSSNMNINEVLATLASRSARPRRCTPTTTSTPRSRSNDVFPTSIHVAATAGRRQTT